MNKRIHVTRHALLRMKDRAPRFIGKDTDYTRRQMVAMALKGVPFGGQSGNGLMLAVCDEVDGNDDLVFACEDSRQRCNIVTVLTRDMACANMQAAGHWGRCRWLAKGA